MISNQTPKAPVRTAVRPGGEKAARPGAGASAGSWIRAMNVGVLREVALLPVLVLLIIVGAVVSPAFLTVSNFAGHRPAELRARRRRGRREPDPADRRHGPVP